MVSDENKKIIDSFFDSLTIEELTKKIIEAGYMKEKCICIDCTKDDIDTRSENFCAGKICAKECETVICNPKKNCYNKK